MKELLLSLFVQHGEGDVKFMERKFDQLGDLVVDWEHEQLHHTAEDHCLKFDHIDMIIITGDLQVLPWEPQAMQLVSLIHMAKFTNKPLLGIGFGGFAAVYSLATKGARFNILNGPEGNLIDQLATFQHYSIGTGAFPSGWLDKETGDVYTYKKADMCWQPVCNIGIHSVDLKQESILDNEASLPKTFTSTKEDFKSIAPSHQMTITKKSDSSMLHLTPKLVQHKFIRNLPTMQNSFNVKVFHDWRLNRDGSLPPGEDILVLAEGKTGPLILARERMLLLAMRYDHCQETENANIFSMISNFIRDFLHEFRSAPNGKIERSIHEFLFGHINQEGDYDTAHHRKPMAPPLARQQIPTKWNLPIGPVKTDPPAMDMFFRPPRTAFDFDFTVLIAKRRSSNVGKKPRHTIQNPLSARQKRLEKALGELGYLNQHKCVVEKSSSESKRTDPLSLMDSMPETNRDMLAGVIMNDSSITSRRHHNIEYQRFYESIFPKGPPVAVDNRMAMVSSMFSSSITTDTPPQANYMGIFSLSEPSTTQIPFSSQNQKIRSGSPSRLPSPSRVRYADDINNRPFDDSNKPEDDDEGSYNNNRVQPLEFQRKDLPSEMKGYSHAFLTAHRGSIFAKPGQQRQSDFGFSSPATGSPHSPRHYQVPTIENWVEVFKISGAGNPLLNDQEFPENARATVPNSARSIESPAHSSKVVSRESTASSPRPTPSIPSSPARSVNGGTPMKHRKLSAMKSPRSAEDILVAKVQSFLPAQHPASIHANFVEERLVQLRQKKVPQYLNPRSIKSQNAATFNISGTPRNSPYYGKSAYRESMQINQDLQKQRSRSGSFSSVRSGDSNDSSKDDHDDPNRVVEGLVKLVPYSVPLSASVVPYYVPPESVEDKQIRSNHIPSSLHLTAEERAMSPSKRAQIAAAHAKNGTAVPTSTLRCDKFRRPYCNYPQIVKENTKKDMEEAAEYQGTYREEFLSEEQHYRRTQIENKSNFLAGDFRTRFYQHNTAMTVRPEGLVRPCGPYPEPPGFAVPPNTKANDWVFMKDLHPSKEFLAGKWK